MIPFLGLVQIDKDTDVALYASRCHVASLRGTSGVIFDFAYIDEQLIRSLLEINNQEKVSTYIWLSDKELLFRPEIIQILGRIDSFWVADSNIFEDSHLTLLCKRHGIEKRIVNLSWLVNSRKIVGIM